MRAFFKILVLGIIVFNQACTTQPEEKIKIDAQLGEFGAFYTKLNSGMEFEKYSRTGDYADIVVDLGNNDAVFVFWRGSSYLPFLQSSEGKWYIDEIIKRKGDGTKSPSNDVNLGDVNDLEHELFGSDDDDDDE